MAWHIIRHKAARFARVLPRWIERELVEDELRAALEEVGEVTCVSETGELVGVGYFGHWLGCSRGLGRVHQQSWYEPFLSRGGRGGPRAILPES